MALFGRKETQSTRTVRPSEHFRRTIIAIGRARRTEGGGPVPFYLSALLLHVRRVRIEDVGRSN